MKMVKDADSSITVRARCDRSRRKNEEPHSLSVDFKRSSTVEIARNDCRCAIGDGVCHHVLGMLFTLAHYQMLGLKSVPPLVSKTSKPQTWHIPSRREGIKARPVTDLVIQKTKPLKDDLRPPPKKKRNVSGVRSMIYKPFPQPLNSLNLPIILIEELNTMDHKPGFTKTWPEENDVQTFVDSAFGEVPKGCVISYQCRPCVKPETSHKLPALNLPKLECFPTVLGEKESLFYSAPGITESQSVIFESETREQSSSNKWHQLRKFRLTASKFKDICSRRKDFERLSTRLINGKQKQTEAMKYGIENEQVATDMYSQQFGRQTLIVGFIINPSLPLFDCSSDRRVQDDTEENPLELLEIKCSMAEKLENLKYLKFLERCGKDELKKVHQYYYQVMGCLDGSYRKLKPSFKDFSRTFQGPNVFFKDPSWNVMLPV